MASAAHDDRGSRFYFLFIQKRPFGTQRVIMQNPRTKLLEPREKKNIESGELVEMIGRTIGGELRGVTGT